MTNDQNSLTKPSDWDEYFSNWHLSTNLYKHYITSVMDKYVWHSPPGKIFEIGSAGSRLLMRSALKGWKISGIDFHQQGNAVLRNFSKENNFKVGQIIDDDICSFDIENLYHKYDVLISSTTLCHFNEPSLILNRWKNVVKPGGIILTVLPNLNCLTGKLMKRFDLNQWNKHKVFTAKEVDQFHEAANLKVITKAYYTGGFDIDFYTPWNKIKEQLPSPVLFKIIKYFSSFVIRPLSRFLPFNNSKLFCRHIICVYKTDENTG